MKLIKITYIPMTLMTFKVMGLKVKVADNISRKCTFYGGRHCDRRFASSIIWSFFVVCDWMQMSVKLLLRQ